MRNFYHSITFWAFALLTASQVNAQSENCSIVSQINENFDQQGNGSMDNPNLPACWAMLNDTDGYLHVNGLFYEGSPKNIYIRNLFSTSGNLMLVSPETDALGNGGYRIRFRAKHDEDPSNQGITLKVITLENQEADDNRVDVQTITLTSSWVEYTVNLPEGTNNYFGIGHGLSNGLQTILVDDIIFEPIPEENPEPEPTNPTQYLPLALTGFNADVVAEGTGGNANNKTTHSVDAFYAFYSQDFVPTNPHSSGVSAAIYGGGLPVNGTLASSAVQGLTFQVADYTASNALILRNNLVNQGVLTLQTPKKAEKIYVAAVRGEGGSGANDNHNVTATVNFDDGTSQSIVFQATAWWQDGNAPANIVVSGTGEVSRNSNTTGWAPRNEFRGKVQASLFYNELALDQANFNKEITSIGFNKVTTSNADHTTAILAVSIYESAVADEELVITGYNYDIIANGIGNASESTDLGMDEQNERALVSLDFQATTSSSFPTYGLPANGIINSVNTPAISYQLADYSGPNALYLTPSYVTGSVNDDNSGTLSFSAQNVGKVYILSTATGGGASSLPYTATVNFSDGTSQVANLQAKDWYGQSGFALQGIGRINRTNNNLEGNASDPRLYEDVITLDIANQSKTITGVSFSFEGNASAEWGNEIRMAVLSIATAEAPEPVAGCTGNAEPGLNPGDTGCITFTYQGQTVNYTTVRAADGNVWLQQNLGSSQIATSADDELSYGDYFQWGRWDDGHQLASSPLTATPPSPNNPSGLNGGDTSFYSVGYQNANNWWSGGASTDTWTAETVDDVTSTNGCDPCKAMGEGWRLPTIEEVSGLISSENLADNDASYAFLSNLKIPSAGIKEYNGMFSEGVRAYLWASSPAEIFYSGLAVTVAGTVSRDTGVPIRCIYQMPVVEVTSVSVQTTNNAPATIVVTGGTLQLNATVNPENANQQVVWSVASGTQFATVNQDGLVSGVSNGTAVVRATSVADDTQFGEITVTLNMSANPYCTPTYSGWAVNEPAEPITLVQFGFDENLPTAINNPSVAEVSVSTPRYEDFSSIAVDVKKGETYTLRVKGHTNGDLTNYFTIYFDWNGDGVFSNTTPNNAAHQEQLLNQPEKHQITSPIQNSDGEDDEEMVHYVTIPNDAITGQTRMRIVKNLNAPSNHPCSNPFFPRGQVEDYTLNIINSVDIEEVTVTTQNNVAPTITTANGTLQLVASVAPVASASQNVTWSVTSGATVVSVNSGGLVTALTNTGTATVRATSVQDNTKFDDIQITVNVVVASPCDAVETFAYDFNNFTAFPEQCWAASQTYPMISLTNGTDKAVQIYSSTSPTANFYIVSPAVSTINGQYVLEFDLKTLTTSAIGSTLQIGTLSSQTDYTGFVPVGSPIVLGTPSTYTSIPVPATQGHQYVAIRFIPTGVHQVITIDNVEWKLADDLGTGDFDSTKISVYPNPSKGLVHIDTNSEIKAVEVFNLLGQKVISTKAKQVDLSAYSSGVYLFQVIGINNETKVFKVVKQ